MKELVPLEEEEDTRGLSCASSTYILKSSCEHTMKWWPSVSREGSPHQESDLGLLSVQTVRNKYLLLKTPVCGISV